MSRYKVEERTHEDRTEFSADNPDRESDYAEFYDVVALSAVERGDGTPIRVWTRAITAKERAERARRRGYVRPSIPELDHGLRR